MSTDTISFEIPKELLASLNTGILNSTRELRILGAISYYQEKNYLWEKQQSLPASPD